MRRAVSLAALAVVALAGCAKASPPVPASQASSSPSVSATSSVTTTATPTVSASAAASASVTSSASGKPVNAVTLPATFGLYSATTTTGTGEQQVVYASSANATDVLNVSVTALADAATVATAYTSPVTKGQAVCGTVSSTTATPKATTTVSSCVLPLSAGSIVVTGSGAQSIDDLAAAANALWAAIS